MSKRLSISLPDYIVEDLDRTKPYHLGRSEWIAQVLYRALKNIPEQKSQLLTLVEQFLKTFRNVELESL